MRPQMIHMRLTEINGWLVSMCSNLTRYYYSLFTLHIYIYIHAKYLAIFLVIFACIMWMVHGTLSEVKTTAILFILVHDGCNEVRVQGCDIQLSHWIENRVRGNRASCELIQLSARSGQGEMLGRHRDPRGLSMLITWGCWAVVEVNDLTM